MSSLNSSDLSPVDFDPFAEGELVDAAPTTAAQREIWVASQMGEEASLAYNESITVEFRGPFDLEAMRAALLFLPSRHEVLRATFSNDGATLCIGANAPETVRVVDLTTLSVAESEREPQLKELVRREVTTPFDLEHGPLFRATIVRMGEQDHRVIIGAHHIVCDGWSFAVLLKDLAPLYNAKRRGVSPELLPLHSFSTYAKEENSRDGSRETRYWLSRFETIPEPLDLPTDRPRMNVRSVAAERVDLALAPELVLSLKKAGARNGASFFVTLFAAFNVFVARLSGQSDLVTGVPAAGQSAVGREMLVGHCANLLPLRMAIDLNRPFSELLKDARKVVLDAYDHQLFTLGDVLPKLKLPRDPARLPLVATLFNLDTGMEGAGLVFEGLEVAFRANARVSETFEIFLNAFETKGGVTLECQYSTALWSAETMRAWLSGYEALLRGVVKDPSTLASRLPCMSESDERRMVTEWNATSMAVPEGVTVLDLFFSQATAHPKKVALKGQGLSLDYEELAKTVRAMASGLRARGVGKGCLVALCVDRSVWMVAAMLAILETGAAYIPVDPQYPGERLAHMVKKAKFIIVEPETESAVAVPASALLSLPELVSLKDRNLDESALAEPSRPGPGDRAYVLFTSGSTGVPKGVEVTHANLVNFVCSFQKDPAMDPSDVLAAVVTLSFDIAGYEIYVPLASGATIVVADRDVAEDGRDLSDLLRREKVTVLQAPPVTYRLLKAAQFDPRGLKALAGGELLPPDLAAWLVDGGAELINCYGPTETTIWSTLHHVTDTTGPIPIGRPIANTQVYVLDAARLPVPVGVFGELYIGGKGVARGYLDDPEKTADRFIADPFSSDEHARLYRTGDTARFRHDGALDFKGRNDDQVKVRGHRIEIGEIEAALARLPEAFESAVGVVRAAASDAQLVAFVVPRPGATVTSTVLRKHLRKSLPEAMIPQHLVEVVALPRTLNGKLDRIALSKLGNVDQRRAREVVPPTTATEKLVADLYRQTLHVEVVGIHDNFFDLGGDSLSSMEAVVQIQRTTGVRIAPRVLLLSSLSEVARGVDAGRPG